MNKEVINQTFDEVQSIWAEGKTPILTVQYGGKAIAGLIDRFGKGGFYTTRIDLDDKGFDDIQKDIREMRDAIRMLDTKVAVLITFRPVGDSYKNALVVEEELGGYCILIKKVWTQDGIEIGKI